MKMVHHYGINEDEKKLIISELSEPNRIGDRYNHGIYCVEEIAGVTMDISDIWFKVYIDGNEDDLSDLPVDEIADKYEIKIAIRGCNAFLASEITTAYKTGISCSDIDEDGEFDIYVNEKSPLYYDLLRDYMIDCGYDWKWGEPTKCYTEHI